MSPFRRDDVPVHARPMGRGKAECPRSVGVTSRGFVTARDGGSAVSACDDRARLLNRRGGGGDILVFRAQARPDARSTCRARKAECPRSVGVTSRGFVTPRDGGCAVWACDDGARLLNRRGGGGDILVFRAGPRPDSPSTYQARKS